MKKDLLEHQSVEVWKSRSPRQWWAFQQLKDDDSLRERVLLAVLRENEEDEAFDDLIRFIEASEAHQRALKAGTVRLPPANGERRMFHIVVSRMTRMRNDADLFFRVDFFSPDGWGGYFDTTNPSVIETVSKIRNRAKPLKIVGAVTRRPYKFYVELGDHVKIV